MKTINVTPTWKAAVQICILAIENGTGEGKKAAKEELLRLAEYVDRMNAKGKAKGK